MFKRKMFSKAISIILSLALLCTCFSGLVMAKEMDLVPVEESQTVEDLAEVEEFAEVEEELPTLEEDIPLDSISNSDSNSEELDIYAVDGSKVALKFAGGSFTSGGTVSADLMVYNADFLGVNFKINFDPTKLALNTNTAGKATLGKAITCNHYDSEEETGLFYKADVAFSGDNAKGQVAYVIAIDPNSKDGSIQTNAEGKRYLSAGSEGLKISTLNFVAKGDITLYEEDFTLSDGDNAFMNLSKAGGAEYYNPELAIEGLNRSSYNITWNLTSLTTSAGITVAANGAYTATLKANESYKLPETIEITMNSAGLIAGTDYTYSNSSGQITISEVKGDLVIRAAGVFNAQYDVGWAGTFNLNKANNNLTSLPAPYNPDTAIEVWATPSIVGNGQITIVGDYVYTYDGTNALMTSTRDASTLYKINKDTGEVVASLDLGYNCGFYYAYTCYGEGKIFVAAANGIAAVDVATFTPVWKKDGGGGQYPAIQYHDGYLYTSNQVVRASDGTLAATLEGSYNYASGVFVTNDQGHDIYYKASWTGVLYGFDTDDNWKIVDSYTYKTTNNVNLQPGVAYSSADNRLYWADAMTSQVYSIALDSQSLLNDDSFLQVTPASSLTTTCTPVIFNGRVYVAGQGNGMVEIFDSSNLKSIYYADQYGKMQSTPILITSEFATTGKVYLVGQTFGGELRVLEDYAGKTSGTVDLLINPSITQYAYEQLAIDSEGSLYYMNDSGYLMKVINSIAYLNTIELTGTYDNNQITLSKSGFEYAVPSAEGATSIGVSYTLAKNCTATFNGVEANTGGTVTLDSSGNGNAVVVVSSHIAGDTHTYNLKFVDSSSSASLADIIMTNRGNRFMAGNLVDPTPAVAADVYTYYYTGSNRTNFAFIPVPANANDKIKVKPITAVGSSTVLEEDGSIKAVTSPFDPNQPYYWVYLASGLNYALVEVEITSDYTGQSKNYQLVLQKNNNISPVQIAEDITNGTVTVDPNNQRGATGDLITFTAAPSEGYALQSLAAVSSSGQLLALTNGENNQYSFTMPQEAVTIKAVFGEAGSTVRSYNVFTDLVGLNLTGEMSVKGGTTYTANLAPLENYTIPANLHLTMGGQALVKDTDYSFSSAGVLSIPKINGDLIITSLENEVTFDMMYLASTGAEKVQGYTQYSATLSSSDPVASLPATLLVKAGDNTLKAGTDYSYDSATGQVVISAETVNDDLFIGYDLGEEFTMNKRGTLTVYNGKGGEVVVPMGVKDIGEVFQGRTDITSITLPATVTSIAESAFQDCTELNTINLPIYLDDLGFQINMPMFGPYNGCSKLTTFNVAEGNKNFKVVDGIIFNPEETTLILYPIGRAGNSYTVPAGITTIGETAFFGNLNLAQVILPDGLRTIDRDAFKSTALKQITIPGTVTKIGSQVFQYCEQLETAIFENGSEDLTIDHGLFASCPVLSKVVLPHNLVNLGAGAFRECVALKTLELPSRLTILGSQIFYNCTSLEELVLPDSLTSIGSEICKGCLNLKSFTFSPSLTTFYSSDVRGCHSLKELNLPEGVTHISLYVTDNQDYNWSSLKEFVVPASVTKFEGYYTDTSLEKIVFLNPGAFEVDKDLVLPDNTVIYGYPGSSAESYAIANSRTFVSLGNYNTVAPTISGEKASVTLEATSSGDIGGQFFNVTSSDGNIKTVEATIKESLVDQVSSSGSLGIKSNLGEVVLGHAAIDQLNSVSGDLTLTIEQQSNNFSNPHAGNYGNAVVLEITLTDSEGQALLTSGNNEITLKLPAEYGNKEIYLLTKDGKLVKLNAQLQNGCLVATINHFSTYLLMNNQEVDNGFTVSATTSNSDISGTDEFAVDLVVSSSKATSFASLQTSLNYDPALVQYVKAEALVPEAGRNFIAQATSSGKVNLTLAGEALALSSGQLAVARVIFTPVAASDTAVNFALDAKTQVGTTAQIQDSIAASTNPLTVNLHNLVISFASADAKTTMTSVNTYARYNSSGLYTDNTYATAFTEPIATTSSGYLLKTNNQGEQLWTDGNSEYSFAELMAKAFTDNASFSPAYEVQNVSGQINFIADNGSQELNYFAAPAGYHLLVFTPDSSGKNYTYNGQAMFKALNMYNGQAETELFLYFVPVGVNTAETALAKMNSTDKACQTIVYDKDLNLNGGVNIIDAQIAYDLYTELSSLESDDFSLLGMRNRLEADVNKDGSVNTTDAWSVQRFVMEQMQK